MRVKKSRFDPYDIERKRAYLEFQEGEVRVRVWRNESWKGYRPKFDLVHVVEHGKYEEYCQGIPLEHALDACLAMQKFIDWVHAQRCHAPARRRSPEDSVHATKNNRKR